ncbi:MAG: bifunctional 5,10-methylenetetrahydrofolate dehydrogenase/5,10-methenyltetrahydrofolate cyclohydrolase [Patescibacteria group bacterium]
MKKTAKLLNGSEVASYIKQRQAKAVTSIKQSGITPKLAIIRTNPNPVVASYMRIKTGYAQDIGAEAEVHEIDQTEAISLIKKLNKDDSVHGIIVQIPLPDRSLEKDVLNSVSLAKDVDGLAEGSKFDCPTPLAIIWLLAGYNIDLSTKKILIVGLGGLVGEPLLKMMQDSGYDVSGADKRTKDLRSETLKADVIISCTGVPALITSDMVKPNVIIVDAGVATDKNGLVGDVADDVREMPDITITPLKGGVGPLTVTALYENVLTAARNQLG